MTPPISLRVFLVDDDAFFLASLEIEFLQHPQYSIESFSTGEQCLEKLSPPPDIIILDYHLNGIDATAMNGLETLIKIKAHNPDIPVIVLSAQDKIEVAVNCMHHKATDYVVKNQTAFLRLNKIIDSTLLFRKTEKQLKWYMERM